MNSLYVGSSEPLESVLDVRQVATTAKRLPFAQPTLMGATCCFETVATLGEFVSCLRHSSHFTLTATELKVAIPWQLDVYAKDRQSYAAVSESYRQRAEVPRNEKSQSFSKQWQTRKTLRHLALH